MKILSKKDWGFCNCYLYYAKNLLQQCRHKMVGKYGTSRVTRDIDSAIRDIDVALSFAPRHKFWNLYKYPPNTPKARRLGWYPDGGGDAEK